MFCFHKWSTPIVSSAGSYQACEKCGKFMPMPCFHKWAIPDGNKQTCEKCGEIRMLPYASCSHVWEEKDISYVGAAKDCDGKIATWRERRIRFSCKHCGEQKIESL